ncbi:MAG: hypothetical protein WHU94_00885 [Thermogemmata sp.]|jgi:hypothetical protein|nr:hypothetical protein [Thermogemmata fonticola]MCX8139669.1 hypothetical protein [Gemmataceae bacterium]
MNRVGLWALCLVLFWVSEGTAQELSFGYAHKDITPELGKKPVYLAGFGHNRRATKVHDSIMARAVVLASKNEKIALVSVDVIGIFLPTVERIRSRCPHFSYILVSSTHNHEGPDTLGLWGPSPIQSGVDPEYMKKLEDGCVEAIRTAEAALQPAKAHIGRVNAPELLRDSRQPIVLHDELVALRFTEAATERSLGLLVQWNNHPEVLDSKNTELTADFPYYVIEALRAKYQCPVIYFTGTVGGLMTPLGLAVRDEKGQELTDGTFAKAERYGRLVADAVQKALQKSEPLRLTPFTIRRKSILVPVDNKLYRLGWQVGTLQRPLYVWDNNPSPAKFVETQDVSRRVAIKTEVGYLQLGDLEVAVIPGEIYPELVLGKVQDPVDSGADFPDAPIEPAIYPHMKKGRHRMIIGLGNDEIGYIIPKRQWDEKPPYCYGLRKAQYGEINSVGPEAAPLICEAFRELTRQP